MDEPAAEEQHTGPMFTQNGKAATDEDLLTELSDETVRPSWGDIRLKFTQGDKTTYRTLRIRPIDVFQLAAELERMPAKVKSRILESTKRYRSAAFQDDANWLQYLAAFVYALHPPMTIRDPQAGDVVWRADGEPQKLAEAMECIPKLGFDSWHINDVGSKALRLTRDLSDEATLGNS